MFLSRLLFPNDAKTNCIHSVTFPPHQTVPEIRKTQNYIGLSPGEASQRDHVKCFIHYFEGVAKLPGNLKCGHNSVSSFFGGIWVYSNPHLNCKKYLHTISTEICISSRQFRFNFYLFLSFYKIYI